MKSKTAVKLPTGKHDIRVLQRDAHMINVQNGWWTDRVQMMVILPSSRPTVFISLLGLVGTEVSEAIEAVRKQPQETWTDTKTKDTLIRELAGCVVRCMDLAEFIGADLGEAIREELAANEKRGYRHGGKAA